jgi:biopolymer transport protein ExbD
MSKFKKKKGGDTPAISTASLPDIVFMLLFFFMVVTVLRDTSIKVQQDLPYADQVEKLEKKNLVMYIYAGKPSKGYQGQYGDEARIQLNDKFASVKDIQQYIYEERQSKREELRNMLITSLKVDQETNMGLISDIKQELREAEALKINYTSKEGDAIQNMK